MEIIGTIPKRYSEPDYIVRIGNAELTNLMGYRYTERELNEKLAIGNIIPIGEMYDRLYILANKEKELMEIAAKLKAAADFVSAALPVIKDVTKSGQKEEK